MKICNFGSLNIDHVYGVPHFVCPGETLATTSYEIFPGGKGLNQSIALARSGAEVHHAGAVGMDGEWLLDLLKREGIKTDHVRVKDLASGHAVIQVIPGGENAIFLHGGANRSLIRGEISLALRSFTQNDYLLLQNEINDVAWIIEKAAEKGMKVVLNPAPLCDEIPSYPLECVDILILNEVEGAELSGEREPVRILQRLRGKYPGTSVVLTLGKQGVIYSDSDIDLLSFPAFNETAVDTTGAGDTFIGYFLGSLLRKSSVEEALQMASKASALCIKKMGAASSIPLKSEVDRFNANTGAKNDIGSVGV